jgi:GNAT superfamily N-acetyltransferase
MLCQLVTAPEKKRPEGLTGLGTDEVVRACELNYIDYWRSATAASAGEYSEEGGIVRCVTGLPQDIFNVVLYCRLAKESVSERIDRAIDEFRALRIPMIWHVGKTSVPDEISPCLESKGFPHDYDLIAMAADLTRLPGFVRGEGVSVKRCDSIEDREHWMDCLARSWDSPTAVTEWMRSRPFFSEASDPSYVSISSRTMYLGLLDGVPCGALMLLLSRGVAGLQCVGTTASARRKGVGEALVRMAFQDASVRGHRFAVVLSTTEGVPLYKKSGFMEFGRLPEHSLYFDRMPR